MALSDIITAIQNKPLNADGSLTLVPSDFGGDAFMGNWFTNVLQVQTFTVSGAQRGLGNGTLTVSGTAGIWGNAALGITFSFSADADGNVEIGITAAHDPSHAQTLTLLPWLQATGMGMSATFAQPDELALLSYSCTLQPPGHPGVQVTISRTGTTGWRIAAAENNSQAMTVDDIVALLNGNALLSFLPQAFINALSGITVNNLYAHFDTGTNVISMLQAGFTVTNGWGLAPGVALLPGLQVNLTLLQANDPENLQFTANVKGTFQLGGTAVPVLLGAALGTDTTWSLGLQQGQSVTLPAFTSLLQLAGDAVYNAVPAGLRDLPSVTINSLLVNFDSTQQVLNEVSFSIASTSGWALLPGYFEVNNFQIALDITNVGAAAGSTITGSVNGLFRLGPSLYFMCTIAQDGSNTGWTLNAGLPPGGSVTLAQLASALFANQLSVPANVPTITFNSVNADVSPDAGTFTLTAQSTGTWAIFSGFAISGFTLNMSRAATSGNPITAGITAELIVGSTGIYLTAALSNNANAGWQFTGATQPGQSLPIGSVFSYLASVFDMSAPPAWMTGITLENLSVSFNTEPGNESYQFAVSGSLPLAEENFQVTVLFDMNGSSSAGFTKTLSGTVTVNSTVFALAFDSTTTDTYFTASWGATDPSAYVSLANLVTALGITLPGTDALNLLLKNANLAYDFTQHAFSLGIASANYGSAAFVSYLDASETRQYYFGMNVSESINLSNLPLVSTVLPASDTMQIDGILASITSTPVTSVAAISNLNALLGANAPQVPAQGITYTVQFSLGFNFGGTEVPVALGFGGGSSAQPLRATLPGTAPGQRGMLLQDTPANGIHWFSVQRSFGPLSVSRIGLQYQNNVISIPIDASLIMGGFEVDVMGLSVGLDIRSFTPQFGIQGLGIDYSNSTLEIGGAFLKLHPPQSPATLEFAGGVVVKTGRFSVAASGAYAQIPSGTSLFLFAAVSAPFGGPPFFFITGFCGGFGYNSSLRIPTIDEVYQFPFVAGLTDPSKVGGSGASPLQAMEAITGQGGQTAWVTPAAGEMWAAVGIQFTTFSIINSTALLTAVFGNDFKLALIGLSTASFPVGAPQAYAYVELGLEALFDPDDGVIAFSAVLSPNSYVIDPDCHLTGGYAMYFWYGNSAYAGDFVTTLGGYSHYFNPPSWYPQVPRLGFNWSLDSNISITGGAYFALTPSALMAGGSLVAMYQSGNLKAWFTAYADIVIWWNPFHFIADIGLTIGASYKMNLLFTSVTVSVEMGADLTLWGPPTGGTVTVYWWVISFTIGFGAGLSQGIQQQQWSDFQQVLPAATDAVKFTAVKGLTAGAQPSSQSMMRKGLHGNSSAGPQTGPWLVRADRFQFVTDAAVPVSELYIGKQSSTAVQTGSKVNIRPMQQTELTSTHRVYVQLADGTEIDMLDPQHPWSWAVNAKNVPNALWGTGDCSSLSDGSNQLVAGQYAGMVFTAPDPTIGYTPGVATLQNLETDPLPPGVNPLVTGQAASGPIPQQSTATIAQVAQISQAQTGRNEIAAVLQSLGITVTNDNPVNLGTNAGALFSDEPMLINPSTSTPASAEQNDTPPSPLLTYSVSSDPAFVQVSTGNGDPSTAKIIITVSNNGVLPVTVSGFTFSFNIGSDAADLTTDASSIETVSVSTPAPSPQWNITALADGQFQATPVKPEYGTVTGGGLSFVFFDINVNTVIGITPVVITETTTTQTASTTQYITKYLPGFYVDNFKTADNNYTVKAGDTITLTWEGSENAVYTMQWDTSSEDVTSVRTFTSPPLKENPVIFHLVATALQNGQTVTATLTQSITVLVPQVDTFAAAANPVNLGDQVVLSWTTENADHCRLVPAMGTGKLGANGSTTITPSLAYQTFNLYAYDAQELCVAQAQPDVVIQFNNGSIASFTVSPSSVYAGGPVTFSWTLVSANNPSINQGIGPVNGTSYTTNIQSAASYTLSCQGAQGNIISDPLPVSIIPLAQFLTGQTYNIPYIEGETMVLEFTDGTHCTLGFTDVDPSQWMTCTWTVDGTTITTAGGFTLVFTFDVPTNTISVNPQSQQAENMKQQFMQVVLQNLSPPTGNDLTAQAPVDTLPKDNGPSVLLNYSLSTTPDPVQVSVAGESPNTASITVVVSNGGVTPVACNSILFSFNIGDIAQDLTNDAASVHSMVQSLSTPPLNWTVTSQGNGQFLAEPLQPGDAGINAAGLSFSFYDINVNTEVGTTILTITETTSLQTASTTFSIGKFPAGFTAGNFKAEPKIIGVGATTVASWSGSPAQYLLSWDTQTTPIDVSKVNSYSISGLTQNTTLYLQVTATLDGETVQRVLTFPVTVLPVKVDSFMLSENKINLGDSVTLNWTTENADHCELSPPMGTTTLDANGSVSIVPTLDRFQFILVAYSAGSLTSVSSVPLSIQFNPGVINSFTASVQQTYVNGPFSLSWEITSALSPSISPGFGVVSGNSVQTTALASTTFVLTCQAVSGPISQSVPVTIISVAQYLVGTTYGVRNPYGVYEYFYHVNPDDVPDEDAALNDTLNFTSASTATYSWTYLDINADDETTIAQGSQSYGTWSIDGNNLVTLATPQGTFTFQFDAANNTLLLQNPPDLALNIGTAPSEVVRYNCTFSQS